MDALNIKGGDQTRLGGGGRRDSRQPRNTPCRTGILLLTVFTSRVARYLPIYYGLLPSPLQLYVPTSLSGQPQAHCVIPNVPAQSRHSHPAAKYWRETRRPRTLLAERRPAIGGPEPCQLETPTLISVFSVCCPASAPCDWLGAIGEAPAPCAWWFRGPRADTLTPVEWLSLPLDGAACMQSPAQVSFRCLLACLLVSGSLALGRVFCA
ncbi:hypothetical protein B0T22DRAFT_288757 [Podospora appendiculata]|uniref:Uncharacterized protein n=1 Tax=Podospora appendiculata TaxID=314037 RepID=A0AAE0X1C1_9PEZI|nr:hypothetical protein B0T22DRAFT_288757 [Podospora appendiculata]